MVAMTSSIVLSAPLPSEAAAESSDLSASGGGDEDGGGGDATDPGGV